MRRVLLLSCVLGGPLLQAQPGLPDPSFSDDGLLVNDLWVFDDEVHAVHVRSDGRILGAGWTDDGDFITPFVQQLLPDGSPDPDFGPGDVVYFGLVGEQRYPYAVGVQSSGAVIVAGLVYDASFDGNVLLARLLPDGTPDPDFGTEGIISSDLGAPFGLQSAWAMRVMPDDRIVITGVEGDNGLVCARFNADGTLDAGFGTDGVAYAGVPFSNGLCLDLTSDGSIVAGGFRVDGTSDWLLARFDPDGVLDPGFGSNGIVTFDIGGGDVESMRGVAVLSDGRIATCGYRGFNGLDDEPAVALFTANGEVDPGFGSGGVLLLPYAAPQWGQAHAIIAQPDDKLLVAGFRAQPGSPPNNDFFLLRLLNDGTFDPSFANSGQVHTDVSGSYDRAFAMACAPDGAIVLAGYGTGSQRATAYVRYQNDIGTSTPDLMQRATTSVAWPVPVRQELFLRLPEAMHGNGSVRITDMHGRELHTVRASVPGPDRTMIRIAWPEGLPDGQYLVQTGNGAPGIPVTVVR